MKRLHSVVGRIFHLRFKKFELLLRFEILRLHFLSIIREFFFSLCILHLKSINLFLKLKYYWFLVCHNLMFGYWFSGGQSDTEKPTPSSGESEPAKTIENKGGNAHEK